MKTALQLPLTLDLFPVWCFSWCNVPVSGRAVGLHCNPPPSSGTWQRSFAQPEPHSSSWTFQDKVTYPELLTGINTSQFFLFYLLQIPIPLLLYNDFLWSLSTLLTTNLTHFSQNYLLLNMLKFLNKGEKRRWQVSIPYLLLKVSLRVWTSWFKQNVLVKDISKNVRKDVEDMPPQKNAFSVNMSIFILYLSMTQYAPTSTLPLCSQLILQDSKTGLYLTERRAHSWTYLEFE